MKFMTFNSSCSFAGVCNLLEMYNVELQDFELALRMKAPYLYAIEDGVYKTGAMLQSAKWFNLALHPIGFHLVETNCTPKQSVDFLKKHKSAMIGIRMHQGYKHAVNFIGMENERFVFLNNQRENDQSEEILNMTESELMSRLDDVTVIAVLQQIDPQKVDFDRYLTESMIVLKRNVHHLSDFMRCPVQMNELKKSLNQLFRPLFLDGVEMMALIHENQLAKQMRELQNGLMNALRSNQNEICLTEWISYSQLEAVCSFLEYLIKREKSKIPE